MLELLNAIEGRFKLELLYNDIRRLVMPCCVGLLDNGTLCVRVYQINSNGVSTKDGFKLLRVSRINSLKTVGEFYTLPAGYKKNDSSFKTIFAEL